jgi:hypothetical protein
MSLSEVANVMIEFGATRAINLDGGGSTTLVFANPTPRLVNIPSGGERAVANNLGIFATQQTGAISGQLIYADFEGGSANFGHAIDYSGSTKGILTATSRAERTTVFKHSGRYSQRLIIDRDPAVTSTPDNPDGWFVRHVSGNAGSSSPASPAANTPREARGLIGFWALAFVDDVQVTIAIDDPANVTADRGILRPLIGDGQWHRYAWDLDDDDDWEGWLNGDGTVRSSTFTIDSIQILGRQHDATIYFDDVFHEIMPDRIVSPADHNADGLVNRDDLALWRHGFASDAGGDSDNDADTDGADFLAWQRRLGTSSGGPSQAYPLPEPAPATWALTLIPLMAIRRQCR